jgi:hypothetical protein
MNGKPLTLLVGLVLGIAGTLLFTGGPAKVAADCPGDPGTPCGNGDVNGSGDTDIADAVYLLSYLFASGAAPVAIECPECPACDSCCPPCPPPILPATGQTKCYDFNGNEIGCASADWPGQDGSYQKGCPTVDRFVDNGDGTVTDNCTGLMWQKETAPGANAYTWQTALQYCEGLELAGHDDWRLPNVRELQSIVDFGRTTPPIDPVFDAMKEWYWSSSANVGDPGYAWGVDFIGGGVNDGTTDTGLCVRAVRDAN